MGFLQKNIEFMRLKAAVYSKREGLLMRKSEFLCEKNDNLRTKVAILEFFLKKKQKIITVLHQHS